MRIAEFLRADFVLARLEASDLEGVVAALSGLAARAGLGSEQLVAEKLMEREQSHSTVMGGGLAIPHATIPGLEHPVIGVAWSEEPINFGPPELDPVSVFFVLLSPPGREAEHVKLLARICRLGRRENFLERLAEAETEEAIVQVVQSIDAQHV